MATRRATGAGLLGSSPRPLAAGHAAAPSDNSGGPRSCRIGHATRLGGASRALRRLARRLDRLGTARALSTSHRQAVCTAAHISSSNVAVLVAGNDEQGLNAALSVARAQCDCRVIGLFAEDPGHGMTANQELNLHSMGTDAWRLAGTLEDAVTCALEPGSGLLACLQLAPALCIIGLSREPSLGEDQDHSRSASAAKRASVIGVPTVAIALPSAAPNLSLEPPEEALRHLLPRVLAILPKDAAESPSGAINYPRAHFPFPSRGRWSGLGGPELPGTDEELTGSLASGSSSPYSDFAAADCWSYGSEIPQSAGGAVPSLSTNSSALELQDILREAFREGDTFLVVHVPPKWSSAAVENRRPFSSARAGVLWHQETVSATLRQSCNSAAVDEAQDRDDLWGRSLPQQTIGQSQPNSEGAVFVPQLNTAKVIRDTRLQVGESEPDKSRVPVSFTIGKGTVLMDASVRGDVDAVFSGTTSVTTAQTWPQSHAFSLLDRVMVEALREDSVHGLPAWLAQGMP